jgi:hypothetical protein
MEQELWKDIQITGGFLQISTFARVRSIDRLVSIGGNKKRQVRGRIRKQVKNANRYLTVGFRISDGRHISIFVHKEVARAFIPNPENKPEVNHLDGDKNNCLPGNLAWATRLENIEHAFKTGLIVPAVGQKQSNTRLTDDQVREIFNASGTVREIGKRFGIQHSGVCKIKNGGGWNHITGMPRNYKRKHECTQ